MSPFNPKREHKPPDLADATAWLDSLAPKPAWRRVMIERVVIGRIVTGELGWSWTKEH